ncbi:MAG: acyl carrier protein [Firmicutes bacterium HGW-Firmicutes-16]|nr:MAG: acyl carrier protein [Firmicutes bacterium HGW-Firmicutes-16]
MVFERIQKLICEQFVVDPEQVTMETAFVDDLGADSLDVVELTMALEEEFSLAEVSDEELKKILTVGDLVEYVSRYVQD